MQEILAENLDLAIKELNINATKTFEDDKYQIWSVEDNDFKKMCNIKEEDWKDEWGMWRSSGGCNLTTEVRRFHIGNKYMYGFDGDFREDEIEDMKQELPEDRYYTERKYADLYEYIYEEIRCSQPRNVVAVCMDLARLNKMTMGELFNKYAK